MTSLLALAGVILACSVINTLVDRLIGYPVPSSAVRLWPHDWSQMAGAVAIWETMKWAGYW